MERGLNEYQQNELKKVNIDNREIVLNSKLYPDAPSITTNYKSEYVNVQQLLTQTQRKATITQNIGYHIYRNKLVNSTIWHMIDNVSTYDMVFAQQNKQKYEIQKQWRPISICLEDVCYIQFTICIKYVLNVC